MTHDIQWHLLGSSPHVSPGYAICGCNEPTLQDNTQITLVSRGPFIVIF